MAGSSTVGQNNQGGTIVNREDKGSREAWRPDQTGKTNRGLGDTGVRKTVTPYRPPTAVVTTPPPSVVPTVKAPTRSVTSSPSLTSKSYGAYTPSNTPVDAKSLATYAATRPTGFGDTMANPNEGLSSGYGVFSNPGGFTFSSSTNPNSAGKSYSTVTVSKQPSTGTTSVGNWGSSSDAGKSLPTYK